MDFSIEQINAKVEAARAAVDAAQESLDYWKSVLDVVANPRFAELEFTPESSVKHQSQATPSQLDSDFPPPRKRGEMKRLTLECLPYDGNGMPAQELAVKIAAAGYEFRTKTPHISVNEALQALKDERKVRMVGRLAHNNAVLWLRVRDDIPEREIFHDPRGVSLQ